MSTNLLARFRQRTNLARMAGHSAWMLGDRVIRAALGVIVGALVARHLGPDSFGMLSLVFAHVLLFASIAGLGMDGVLVRDLVRNAPRRQEILGTAFVIKFYCGIAVFVLGNALVVGLRSEPGLAALIALGSCALFFYAFDVIDSLFQSRLEGRAIVTARTTAFVVISGLRFAFVLAGAPLAWFAATAAIEVAVGAALIVAIYLLKDGSIRQWTFERRRALELVRTSLPVAASGFFVTAILQVDKLILESMAGTHAVGIYSAASMLSIAWYMLPVVLGSSVAPRLTALYEANRADYERRLQDSSSVLTCVMACAAAFVTVAAQPLIELMFGDAYADAALVLTVHFWAGIFVAHVSIRTWALLIEGKIALLLAFSALALLANIVLNLVLIERYAEAGAAFAALISWGLSALVFPLVSAQSRGYVRLLLKSFNPLSWARALSW